MNLIAISVDDNFCACTRNSHNLERNIGNNRYKASSPSRNALTETQSHVLRSDQRFEENLRFDIIVRNCGGTLFVSLSYGLKSYYERDLFLFRGADKCVKLVLCLCIVIKKNIDFFLFSQVVMSPYGYTKVKPESFDEQAAAMMAFVDGLKTQFNATFRYGTAANTMCKCVHWWS